MHTKIYASSLVLRRWRMSGHTKDELYNKQESNYENIPIGPPSSKLSTGRIFGNWYCHPDVYDRVVSHP